MSILMNRCCNITQGDLYGLLLPFLAILFNAGCRLPFKNIVITNNFDSLDLGTYVESDFPFITTLLDLRGLPGSFPKDNLVSRGIVMRLGDSAYACFDTDLLRWSVGWTGDFMALTGMAQRSYDDFFDKANQLPEILGEARVATGGYPGWEIGAPTWSDPREKSEGDSHAWGPVDLSRGRYEGLYMQGQHVVLAYQVGQTAILERPEAQKEGEASFFVRQLHLDPHEKDLYLHVAEVADGVETVADSGYAYVVQGQDRDSVTAVGFVGKNTDAVKVDISDNRYLDVVFGENEKTFDAGLMIWKGPMEDLETFRKRLRETSISPVKVEDKKPVKRWPEKVYTAEKRSPDTAALVMDQLMLPLPNPWQRNVRVMDIAFYPDGTAMVVTFEGDVWKVKGIGKDYMTWSRYASGLNEPMGIRIKDNEVYVFDRLGITQLIDRNGDGEADFYKNFSNIMPQSMGTREWASSLELAPQGGFYVAKGASLANGPIIAPRLYKWFQMGSLVDGSIVWISENGQDMETVATGLRGPFIGINPHNGMLFSSDQQGNYVPSTPVLVVKKGDYFGVPATAHGADTSHITAPLQWLPHNIDPSGLGELWLDSKEMGPLNHQLIHISFGRPGLFRILIDSSGANWQGGANLLDLDYPSPTSKGAVNPKDGQAYFTGFNLWGSRSKGISSLIRLRYVKDQVYKLPVEFRAGQQGLILRFEESLDSGSVRDIGNYSVKRYNYLRTQEYGSGHYKLDGSEGEEMLPVVKTYLSKDGKVLFLNIPNMEPVDQMEISYRLNTRDQDTIEDEFWFTLNDAGPMDLTDFEFRGLKESDLILKEKVSSLVGAEKQVVSAEQGKQLFENMGCAGCHSAGTTTAGKYGPPFQGLFGSTQEFEDGTSGTVDEDYIRESILNPSKQVVKGYGDEMPSFRGILNDDQIESLILYIRSLTAAN